MPPTLRRSYRFILVMLHLPFGAVIAAWLKLTSPLRRRPPGTAASPRWWFGRMCRILGLRVQVVGEASALPALWVPNHISWMDIVVLGSVAPVNFVSKAEIRSWPLFGWMARAGGTVFIPRGAHQARAVVDQVSQRLNGGCNVVIFAEGTTSDGRQVHKFYPRLFAAAVETACPVQPVAMRYPHADGVHPAAPFVGDDPFLTNLLRVLEQPSMKVEVTFCEVFSASERDRRGLADQASQAIARVVCPPLAQASGG